MEGLCFTSIFQVVESLHVNLNTVYQCFMHYSVTRIFHHMHNFAPQNDFSYSAICMSSKWNNNVNECSLSDFHHEREHSLTLFTQLHVYSIICTTLHLKMTSVILQSACQVNEIIMSMNVLFLTFIIRHKREHSLTLLFHLFDIQNKSFNTIEQATWKCAEFRPV
jgi:hypothetical protein